MPPEPLPSWDRKDFFREKRHDRTEPLPSVTRWREPYQSPRDLGREDPRRPPGPGKQGNYHFSPDESGYGVPWPRGTDRMVEDETCRVSVSRHGRGNNGRENKGSAGGGKDWKAHQYYLYDYQQHRPWEAGPQPSGSVQRSVDDDHHVGKSYPSSQPPLPPQSDSENTSPWNQPLLKDQNDKMAGGSNSLAPGHVADRDHSLGSLAWKPLKWSRSGSLSSRGSGSFSLSDDVRIELPPGKSTPVQSPSTGDVSVGALAGLSFEESCPRKKQRLGWGQGLAKYEKQKTEGPEEIGSRTEFVQFEDASKMENMPNLVDRSPKSLSISECRSPATPSSVACSSSPGVDEKTYDKISNAFGDICNASDSPSQGFPSLSEDFSINPSEPLELDAINNIGPLLADIFHSDEVSSGVSNFMRYTAFNKLLLVKSNILKALEKTEGEIDSFENKLKSLGSVAEVDEAPVPVLPSANIPKSCNEQTDYDTKLECLVHCNDHLADAPASLKDDNVNHVTDTSQAIETACMECHASDSGLLGVESEYSARAIPSVAGGSCLSGLSTTVSISHGAGLRNEADYGDLATMIFTSNKALAREASKAFDKVPSSDRQKCDVPEVDAEQLLGDCKLRIKEKISLHRSFQRFKERVLCLKFRAFHHLWKEDLRLLSLRRCRAKSQKKFELSCRSIQGGHYKQRSSIRSRFSSPAGNMSLVPTMEIVDFTGKLLSDSQTKFYRSNLKMPALILDERERKHSKFRTTNGLVDDPCALEKERAMINPWTFEEKEIFMEMLVTFGKNFAKIASFLTHKTTADCVEFYYKNHKSESFAKIKKRLEPHKQGRCLATNTYLVPGKKWNQDANSASLDLVDAGSLIAAHTGKFICSGSYYDSVQDGSLMERKSSVEINVPETENETVAADVLTVICGGLSSEAHSSCITSSVDPGEGFQSLQKKYTVLDQPFTPEVSQNIDEDDTCSDDSCAELDTVDWTDEEKSAFIMGLRSYGRDFASISKCVRTRSREQCKIFFSKARKCLSLDVISLAPDGTPSDANGGGSDSEEDACVVEMDSTICSTQSCSKMDLGLQNQSSGENGHCDSKLFQTDLDSLSERDEVAGGNHEANHCTNDLVGDSYKLEVKQELECDTMEESSRLEIHSCTNSNVLVNKTGLYRGSSCDVSIQADTEAQEKEFQRVAKLKQATAIGACSEELKGGPGSPQLFLPDYRREVKIEHDDDSSGNVNFVVDSNGNRNSSHFGGFEASKKSDFSFVSNYQHKPSGEVLNSLMKRQIFSWLKKENCSTDSSASVGQKLSCVYYDSHVPQTTESSPSLKEQESERGSKSENLEFSPQCQLQDQQPNIVVQSVQLKSCSLQVFDKKDVNGDANLSVEKPDKLSHFPKDTNSPGSEILVQQESYHRKSYASNHSHSNLPLPELVTKNHDRLSDASLRLCSQSSDGKEDHKTGDVKLFGQILSHLTPLKKLTFSPENSDVALAPKSNKLNCTRYSEQRTDAVSTLSRRMKPSGHCIGVDDFPMKSYGFWDGTRIQTGLASLPESAVLSKYPGTVADYNQLGRSIPVSKEVVTSTNGGTDDAYQVYRSSFEGGNVQPFAVIDVKQHERILTDLHKQEKILSELQEQRNGYDSTGMLGFQQGVVGMNAVRGGVLMGGGCNGVSDPVTAIKMHYAASEKRFVRGSGVVVRDEDSWRADVGR